MVLGNTFHLFIDPGADYVRGMGGLHEPMGWRAPIITDSGGFQVFSMGHGSVSEEIKRRRGPTQSRILAIDEEGVHFAPTPTGPSCSWGRRLRWRCRPTLASDIALAFDECTPSHADKRYTLRAMERTHRWLDRCTAWHSEHVPGGQALYGIVQGGVHEDLRAESAAYVAGTEVAGIAIGGSLGQPKAEMHEVLRGPCGASPNSARATSSG